MNRHEIINEYFNWLSDTVCENRYQANVSYKKLLPQLHSS